jgi:hypothetical protein
MSVKIKMSNKSMLNDRVEKNLKVLKLLSDKGSDISAEQKIATLNEYSGFGGLREAIFTTSIYIANAKPRV